MTNELAERVKKIERLIPDSNLRDFLFNYDNRYEGFLSNRRKYIDYVKTMLYLVTLLAYKKFIIYKKQLESLTSEERTKQISQYSNAMVRLYNMFDGCFSTGRIDFELVENIILNLQIDAAMNKNRGFINSVGMQQFFNFAFLNNDLGKVIFDLKKSMLSARYVPEFEFDDLVKFFNAFPFLLNATMELNATENYTFPLKTVSLTVNGECLNMGRLIFIINDQINYLYSVSMTDPHLFDAENMLKAQRISAEYVSFCGAGAFDVVFSNTEILDKINNTVYNIYPSAIEDFLLELRLQKVQDENEAYFFREFFFIDNKYIKYLALTISDLINAEGKRKVYEYFNERYETVFKRLSGGQIIRWDEIFVFLLLEVGIYKLLVYLFKNTNLSYGDVKESFRLRFGENVSRLEEECEIIRDPLSGLALRNTNNIINCKAQALILLATRLLTANEVKVSLNDSLASISEIRDDLKAVGANVNLRVDEKILYFANKLINFNSFIVIFYEGLLGCYDKFRARDLDESARAFFQVNEKKFGSDNPLYFRQTTLHIRRKISDKCGEIYKIKFLNEEAMKKVLSIIKQSFDWLIEMNRSLNARNTNKNEQFYDMVGRRNLFDENSLLKFANNLMNAFDAPCDDNKKVSSILNSFVAYLTYMRDGMEDVDAPLESAIYPVIGTCSQTVMSRDGYRYSYLSVNTGKGESRHDIKIISNETMNIGDVYYCVPNIRRCLRVPSEREKEKYIWVNPQIVPYEYYQPNAEAKFEKLVNKFDYEKVAALIYSSDVRLYGKMFGNLENATKVLSILFDQPHSVYNKKYIRLVRKENEITNGADAIVAVATVYPDLPDWDEGVVATAFRCAGVNITENSILAFESLKDSFNDAIGNNYYVSDLCVDEKHRGKGYAKYMLNNLIRMAEKDIRGKNIVLSVYEDNRIAMNLYNLMGFIPYVAGYDNRGEVRSHREKYYKMIKYT